jgi:hypothetical protein
MILRTVAAGGLCLSILKSRQAKSQWRPSSREISSFENVRPGMRPRFLSQKIAQKLPLKKMPSTAANATRRSANELVSLIQTKSPLGLLTNGRNGLDGVEQIDFGVGILDVRVDQQRVGFGVHVFHRDLKAIEAYF